MLDAAGVVDVFLDSTVGLAFGASHEASDVAISQFRFLVPLLFCHGTLAAWSHLLNPQIIQH